MVRIVDQLEKCNLFPDFEHGFRSSQSTSDLIIIVSDRIVRTFNRSGGTQAVALDIFKAFDRVWHAGLLHRPFKSYGISGQIFGLLWSFLSNRCLPVVLDGKSLQEYPVSAGVPKGSILGPTLFLLQINDLLDYDICNIAIYVRVFCTRGNGGIPPLARNLLISHQLEKFPTSRLPPHQTLIPHTK